MSLSNSPLAYADCFEVLDAALADSEGVRVQAESRDVAVFMRMRLHKARTVDRDRNAATYPDDHPMYGRSAYDALICRIKCSKDKTKWYVNIEKIAMDMPMEALSEVEDDDTESVAVGSAPAATFTASGNKIERRGLG